MRSRADTMRIAVERALRVLTLIILAFAAWSATRSVEDEGPWRVTDADLRDSLARWTSTAPPRVHVALDSAADGEQRHWLRALRRTGTAVSWTGDNIRPLALEVAPVAGPHGGTIVWMAAPVGASVAVSDAIAPIDTVVATAGGARLLAPVTTGPIRATIGSQHASATSRDSLVLRRVLLIGQATWEAKFVILALEEAGWSLDVRLTVAPGVEVTQGTPRTPDTARYAAVVVLQAPSAVTAAAIARYVRAGGGAILTGATGGDASLAAIAAGRVGSRTRPSAMAFARDAPRRALGFLTIAPHSDAIVLEERDSRPAVAARRVGSGRVVQVGYDETWRWRLAGGDQALEDHRAWWSTLLSSVAYRAALPLQPTRSNQDAPLARLVDALGPSTRQEMPESGRARWALSPALLFALVSVLLLAELASRRLRGAP